MALSIEWQVRQDETTYNIVALIVGVMLLATLPALAAYSFGVEDGARQASAICVGEDTVRVHRPAQPTGRVP